MELEGIGAKIVAASVDGVEKAREIADGKGFHFGYGVTRSIAEALDSWWEDRRQIIQPSEFVVNADNKIVVSSYSDGPLGRMDAPDIVRLINFYESKNS